MKLLRTSVVAAIWCFSLALSAQETPLQVPVPDTVSIRESLQVFEKLQANVSNAPVAAASQVPPSYKTGLIKTLAQATDHMAKGTRALTGIEKLILGHVSLTNATSPWSDVDIRNWYDELKDWGTVAGSLVAAYGLATSGNSGDQKALKAGGVALVGLSQLTGRFFGTANSNRIKEKAAFLDMTVRAYDDMLAHKKHLDDIIATNENATTGRITRFIKSKEALPAESAASTLTRDELLSHLSRVESDLSEYETAIRELLALSDDLQARAGGYLLALDADYASASGGVKRQAATTSAKIENSTATSKAKEDLRGVIQTLTDFKANYAPSVYEFFNISTEIRNALKDAEATLRAKAA